MVNGQIDFADGNSWEVLAGDAQSVGLVASLAATMQLRPVCNPTHHLVVSCERCAVTSLAEDEDSVLHFCCDSGAQTVSVQLLQLSLALAFQAQNAGGALLHGALAEWRGQGVILAGKSGTGKTTASQRLAPPWRSLCDELTLVTRDSQGHYLARPWPTWSRWESGTPRETWDVHQAVPLRGIFFLTQSYEDRFEPVGSLQAVGLLVNAWDQAHFGMPDELEEHAAMAGRSQGFHTICDLAQRIPVALLHFSKTGAFWQEIERMLLKNSTNTTKVL